MKQNVYFKILQKLHKTHFKSTSNSFEINFYDK